jgi:hypothetical protein
MSVIVCTNVTFSFLWEKKGVPFDIPEQEEAILLSIWFYNVPAFLQIFCHLCVFFRSYRANRNKNLQWWTPQIVTK